MHPVSKILVSNDERQLRAILTFETVRIFLNRQLFGIKKQPSSIEGHVNV
jgi:hypothetical protein